MKRTLRFAIPRGTVECRMESGETISLPLFQGILRHLTLGDLSELLHDPIVARKYTRRALEIAAWPVLREFPRCWLSACLRGLDLPAGRRRALEFMLRVEVGEASAS